MRGGAEGGGADEGGAEGGFYTDFGCIKVCSLNSTVWRLGPV